MSLVIIWLRLPAAAHCVPIAFAGGGFRLACRRGGIRGGAVAARQC